MPVNDPDLRRHLLQRQPEIGTLVEAIERESERLRDLRRDYEDCDAITTRRPEIRST